LGPITWGARRVEKTAHIEDKNITLTDGSSTTVRLFTEGGALGIAERTVTGDPQFVPLTRVRTHRNQDKNGRYRWYNDYQLPDQYGGGTITVRLHGNDQDTARKLNRTENLRPIPPATPTSNDSSPAATTPSPSTGTSTTPCGSAASTASGTPDNC
jgi:hypothetical protein